MADLKVENDNRQEVLADLDKAIKTALYEVGLEAVTNIISISNFPRDTGLLRNSITFAISGKSPAIKSYQDDKGDGSGSYTGTAPNDKVPAVYIGTNVEYAKYVQFGTSNNKHPVDFMFAPLRANLGNYKKIIEKHLKLY